MRAKCAPTSIVDRGRAPSRRPVWLSAPLLVDWRRHNQPLGCRRSSVPRSLRRTSRRWRLLARSITRFGAVPPACACSRESVPENTSCSTSDWRLAQCAIATPNQRQLQRLHDRARHLFLNRHQIFQLPVINFRPQIVAGFGVDQLGGKPHRVDVLRTLPRSTVATLRVWRTPARSWSRPRNCTMEFHATTRRPGIRVRK